MALMRFEAGQTARTFADRAEAGRELGRELARRSWPAPVIVLGLPRGGVAVARPVATALNAPLDVLGVRKVGLPWEPEFAIGAIASGGIVVRDSPTAHRWNGRGTRKHDAFMRLAAQERIELERREALYRAGRPPLNLEGKIALLVDDGLATGSTMIAAIRAAQQAGARAVIAAAPVASAEAMARVSAEADDTVVLAVPPTLRSIGEWYDLFEQLSDEEVTRLLNE